MSPVWHIVQLLERYIINFFINNTTPPYSIKSVTFKEVQMSELSHRRHLIPTAFHILIGNLILQTACATLLLSVAKGSLTWPASERSFTRLYDCTSCLLWELILNWAERKWFSRLLFSTDLRYDRSVKRWNKYIFSKRSLSSSLRVFVDRCGQYFMIDRRRCCRVFAISALLFWNEYVCDMIPFQILPIHGLEWCWHGYVFKEINE